MMRSEIALWPQPAQRVVLPPLYSMTVRPMRLVFGALAGVVAILLLRVPCGRKRAARFHRHQLVGDTARVERQAVDVGDGAIFRYEFRRKLDLEQAEHLAIAILLDDVNAVVRAD